MRSRQLLVATLLLAVAGCSDVTKPTSILQPPSGARYQLSATGTLDAEIHALITVLLPNGLATAAQVRWDGIKDKLQPTSPNGKIDVANARARLVELTDWINKKQSQMNPPPAGESRAAASARLILYMSLYVYGGPATPVPAAFGPGADAAATIVSPTTTTVLQTPTLHAAATFDPGTVAENSIVVVSQNTQVYRHCEGPLTTRYCQYPLFYHYQVFPAQKFQKLVHVAVCHVPTGGNYGPLPGVDHSRFVVIHDKPAAANYTPGGYPVPDEQVEVLPRNTAFSGTAKVSCSGTVYPQVSYFNVPRNPQGFFENARALAVRAANGAVRTVGSVLAPENLYAIDNGEEHNTLTFSSILDADSTGHPDLQVSSSSAASQTVTPGQALSFAYSVVNNGTAPSPTVTTLIQLQPASGDPVTLTPAPALSWSGPLYPLEAAHTETAELTLPATMAPGNYTLSVRVTSVGGLSETVLTNNTAAVTLTVAPPVSSPPTLGVLIYGPTMSPSSPGTDNEQTLAAAAHLQVTVASAETWATYNAEDFAKYNAIVFGDPTCGVDLSPYAAAEANKATWSPVVTGPAIVIGTDPVFHQSQPGAKQLIVNGIKYAASGSATGLYTTLSCSYQGSSNGTLISYLSGVGTFLVGGSYGNSVHILDPSHPAMDGLSDASLSNWGVSVHAFFSGLSSYPNTFHALARALRESDETQQPYIIAR